MSAYLADLLPLCHQAGAEILALYQHVKSGVRYKTDKSPITAADCASNRILVEGINRVSSLPVLSEEGDLPKWSIRQKWREYWLVDPLDGTREFIQGNGEYTVNVAVISDGKPVFGIVYAPVADMFYFGSNEAGAFRQQGLEGSPQPIHCAGVPPPEGLWRVLGSRSHSSPELAEFLAAFPGHRLTPVGSSLKFCLIAEGAADLYPRFGPTSEWDTAAAQAVLEAAGGQVLDWNTLLPLSYNTKDSLLNPPFVACTGIAPIGKGGVKVDRSAAGLP
jgi:3'(2'), 5'-bisphosphate nucleotidase